jgi:alpha-beta hydrolase superfamily lysophospholipase
MGNSTGDLICANYILNPRYFEKKPDFLVLESPLLEFKKLSTFVARPISQILYSIVPDLILSRDGDDPDWLRDNSFFKDSDVPPVNKGKVDYWYNPLSRKPLYVSYLYNCLKMINNIASVKEKVNIPILLFYNPSYDPHINVKVVEDRVRKMTNNPNIYTRVDFNHEIMLDSWHNINYCIRQIGDFVKKPQKAPDKKQKNKN